VERAELVAELKTLRKGRGLQASRLPERVGPCLRAACAVSESDGMLAIRAKVSDRLSELSSQLPEELRLAALAAFAITPEARQPLYQDRVRWTALRVDRDPRTVRRRVDEAIDSLAELASASPASSTPGKWHTAALTVAPASHLVYLPRHRCEAFDLHVRFGAEGPAEVLALDGAFERDVADPGYRGRTLQVDAAGEVHLQFRHLTPGLVYGARWADRP
jgi:hypothetical protein